MAKKEPPSPFFELIRDGVVVVSLFLPSKLEEGELNSTLIRAASAAPFSDKGISHSVGESVNVWADSGTVSQRRLLVNPKCANHFPQLTSCSTL